MNGRRCCPIRTRDSDNARQRAWWRLHGSGEIAGWLVPGVVLALMPKCPLCLAAYVAAVTGLGLSFVPATQLRLLLLTLSVAFPVCLALRRLSGFVGRTVRPDIAP
jgi:hypothetical protein